MKVLDPRVADAERAASLAKLAQAQTSNGAFPWFPGGPPSPFMTLYIAQGLSRAAELHVEVPMEMVQRAWAYLAIHFVSLQRSLEEDKAFLPFLTFLNYVASSYPDPKWTGGALTVAQREQILSRSFQHWRELSPRLKAMLALTLKRMGRAQEATRVFDSELKIITVPAMAAARAAASSPSGCAILWNAVGAIMTGIARRCPRTVVV